MAMPTQLLKSYKMWGGSPRSFFDLKKERMLGILDEILRSKVLENIVADVC